MPSVTLGKAFAELFLGFAVCPGHTAKLLIPVVEKGFRPKKAGKSLGTLDVGFCKMDVTIAWSIILFP